AKSGMYVKDHAKLLYDGPKLPEELYRTDMFRDKRPVRIGQKAIMRTRPVFQKWEAFATVVFEDSIINADRIDEWFIIAGHIVGLGEMRPRYGRFEVVK
ncbi:MAG: hypothetical protein Q8M94_22605, partial [Ignavibacteria bacterium]|nr:hypothetical protein [Ignavibacteria bacterium]